ncbi:uncharacterized protein TNCV_4164891 [Trichonephila clavipes]|nr:uncharacterized protein TNCV_4164891 [Trichonephila clavipes]
MGSIPGEDMDVCKCIVPSRHGGTLKSRRAASPLVRLVGGEERWVAPDHPQGVLPQNWGETKLNRSVTRVGLKVTANRCHFAMINSMGLDPVFTDRMALVTSTTTLLWWMSFSLTVN